MTILEEANLRFPLGTEFKSYGLGGFSSEKYVNYIDKVDVPLYITSEGNVSGIGLCWIYYCGKWAEIVNPVINKNDINYLIKLLKKLDIR